MAFTASFQISTRFLAGNPIPLTISITPGYSVGYRVKHGDALVFAGIVSSITGTQRLDLSRLFSLASVGDGIKTYTIELFHEETVLQSASITVYPGAISKRLHRELTKQSLDIFVTKLKNSTGNYLLTVRSFSKTILIPEDEILPIPHYLGSTAAYFDVKSAHLANLTPDAVYLSTFQVGAGPTIHITKPDAPHTHFIKFRNSFGAQEMIALNDVIDFIPEFRSDDIGIYDHLTGDVISVPYSVAMKGKYTASLRKLSLSDSVLVIDMLMSREQFLVTPEGEFQVIVRADAQILKTTSGIPMLVNVGIESIEEERYYSPIDMEQLGMIYENIFTSEFTMQYT